MASKKASPFLALLPLINDSLLIILSFILAYWVRFKSGWISVDKGIPPFSYYLYSSFFPMGVWVFLFYLFDLYKTGKNFPYSEELYRILKSAVIGTFVILTPTFFLRPFSYSRFVFLLACFLGFLLISLGRWSLRGLRLRYYKKGYYLKKIAIVGEGNFGLVKEAIKNHSSLGYEVVGTISEGKSKNNEHLGTVEEISDIVKRNDIDILLMTFPLHSKSKASKIIERCKDLKVDFLFVPDLFEMVTSRVDFYELNGIPLIRLIRDPITETYKIFKRTVDASLAFALLLISLPISITVAILIKLTSRGPIIYRQRRVGKDGKLFTLYKFRTMFPEAEKQTGPIWAEADDPRVTWIGKKLRRSRLDEIPQLINVLKGEMSIVGPRPERPYFVEKLRKKIPNYTERLKVKPGLTGLAQVNHKYDISLDDVKTKLEYDLLYINKISLPLDLKILIKTVGVVLSRKGAH